jgi:hypothetical protein
MLRGYVEAPVGEVSLAWRAEPCVSRLRGAIPDTTVLQHITENDGVDFATMAFCCRRQRGGEARSWPASNVNEKSRKNIFITR